MGLADRGQTLLGGIVGSRAYGLNQPDSDTDRMRVVALPTTDITTDLPRLGLARSISAEAHRAHSDPRRRRHHHLRDP